MKIFLSKRIMIAVGTTILFFLSTNKSNAQVTKTVGSAGANYSTIKMAFDAINAGTITGAITLQVINSTTETSAASLNASGTGSANYSSVTIYPTVTGKSIGGSIAGNLINLNGADNVTIDGRLNRTGAIDLIISNSSIATNASTVAFANSAENNTVKYCTIKGSGASVGTGVVYLQGSSSGNGNSGNSITYNNITNAGTGRPANAIYSSSATVVSKNNVISFNNIYDIFNAGLTSMYLNIATNSTGFTITGNSMYETGTIATTLNVAYYGIYVAGSTATAFTITNNYIGGAAPQCASGTLTITNTTNSVAFVGISCRTNTSFTVQNNTITKLAVSSASSTSGDPFRGIEVSAGTVSVLDNTIGSSNGTGAITATYNASTFTSYVTSRAIAVISGGNMNISGNSIGSISTLTNNVLLDHDFFPIFLQNSVNTINTIANNLIGSIGTANSIQNSNCTGSVPVWLNCIQVSAIGTTTISGNTIKNIVNNYSANGAGQAVGIYTTLGTNIIRNNSISTITSYSGAPATSGFTALNGILEVSQTTTGLSITGNVVSNLTVANTTLPVTSIGISFGGAAQSSNTVSGNMVTAISSSNNNTGSRLIGISLGNGSTTCANNIIDLGGGVGTGFTIYGIYDIGNSSTTDYYYFNTVYLQGTVSGTTNSTYAFYNANNSNGRNIRNNIFFNARTGGSTGKHYAIYMSSGGTKTIDYNDYWVTGTVSVLGSFAGSDKTTLAAWKSATGLDVNSFNIDPQLQSTYTTYATLNGVSGTGITADYTGIARSTIRIGAIELGSPTYIWKGGLSDEFYLSTNWLGAPGGVVPPEGADISFDPSPTNNCVLDQDRTLGKITNVSAKDFVVNGFQLTLNDSANFSSTGRIDATTTNSTIVYNGNNLCQPFTSTIYKSNTIYNLTVNNSAGLSQPSDFTVSNNLTVSLGTYSIGAHTLTVGSIPTPVGTLTGGSSSNIVIGRVSGVANLPTVTCNNLTVNGASGVNLGGNVSVGGALDLTSGILTLGSKTLTYSGSSITRTSGNINASNVSANIVFANSSAITLPASTFNAAVNNMCITGSGGVTSSSDFTLEGILYLDNGNTSSPNSSSTKGLLDMASNILTMGVTATNTGYGDVTGVIRRNNMEINGIYSFGHPSTTFTYVGSGTVPAYVSMNITIGSTWSVEDPSPTTSPIKRYYEMIVPATSNTTNLKMIVNLHYLDAELNGNVESEIVTGDYDIPFTGGCGGSTEHDEHGISQYDKTTTGMKYVGFANVPATYLMYEASASPTAPAHCWRTIFSLYTHNNTDIRTWDGSVSTNWNLGENWVENVAPDQYSRVTIPDASTLTNLPVLPAGVTQLQSLSIGDGISLTALADLTITATNALGGGAWNDVNGGFIPNGHKVTFTGVGACISGITQFYDVEIANDASIRNMAGNVMRIGNFVTKTGSGQWLADLYDATVEYNKNGAQTVTISDETPHFHTLVLSGSGAKTLPSSALTLHGSLRVTGTATTNANQSITVGRTIEIDSLATFNAGSFTHNIAGSLTNDGTFNASTGTINMNSSTTVQAIDGAAALTTLYNLTLNNTYAEGSLTISSPVAISNTLNLISKNILSSSAAPFTMTSTSSVNPEGGSAISFVDGPMTKEGNTAFVFPLGNGSRWARLGISAPTVSTPFSAQYFGTAYPDSTSMSTTVLPVLDRVSTMEYWHFERSEGAGEAAVTLYCEDASWSGICDSTSLRVAYLNRSDSTWENNNDSKSTTGFDGGDPMGTITTNAAVTRFGTITFGTLPGPNPLPIELLSFNAKLTTLQKVDITWSTASERNSDYFTIERSVDAINFERIATVPAAGTSTNILYYSAVDLNPLYDVSYYRLKQTDYDGKYSYSNIVSINKSGENISVVNVFPNPNNGISFTICFNGNANIQMTVSVYNAFGQEIYEKSFIPSTTITTTTIDLPAKLASGVYTIISKTNSNKSVNRLVVN